MAAQPTIREMHQALVDLREQRISADDFRAVMARSRATRSEEEHHAAKAEAAGRFSA